MKSPSVAWLMPLFMLLSLPGCDWLHKGKDCSSCQHHQHRQVPTAGVIEEVTSSQAFDTLIAKADKPLVVMFGAAWCAVCKEMKPELAKAAAVTKGNYIFAYVDLDQAKELQERYKIDGVPVVHLFSRGKEVPMQYRPTGFTSKEKLLRLLAKYFDSAA